MHDGEHLKVNGSNVIIEGSDGKVLMIRGSYGYWMLPGGGIERAELPVHAAMDEALEETNLLVAKEDLQLVALMVQKVVHKGVTLPLSGLLTLYRCAKYAGELFTKATQEVVEWRFMDLDEVLALYDKDPNSVRRSYLKLLIIHDNIRHGLLSAVYEGLMADPVPLRPTRFI